MSEEYGSNFITITGDDGEEIELEHLDTVEFREELYMAFFPADMEEDDDDFGMIILKVVDDDNEEMLVSVDDEDELTAVHDLFVTRLSDENEEG